MNSFAHPRLSVVIPVYNEEEGLQGLFDRLYPALDQVASQYSLSYELVFINDGSKDRSAAMLAMQYEKRPDVTRVVLFANTLANTWQSWPVLNMRVANTSLP